jgi:flagellin
LAKEIDMGMSLNTNLTASIAHRNLMQSDADMTRSLAKLSSGQRVVSARDDAASMAIGSRLRSDLSALRQIQINATQAMSLLQVAEGAHARVYDMLVRLKALASQAGSASLSNTERSMLDTEYQALVDEIDRVAAATTFNNNQLVNANMSYSLPTVTANTASSENLFGVANATNYGDLAFGGINGNSAIFSFSGSTDVEARLYATAGGQSFSAVVPSNLFNGAGVMTSGTAVRFVSYGTTGPISGNNSYITLTINQGADIFVSNASIASGTMTLGGGSTTSQAFKVGIGSNPTDNEISFKLQGVNAQSLGIKLSNILTQNNANVAYSAIGIATDLLLTFRAEIGAGQSRLESTQQNIAVVVENLDAARSAYLDLDVAQEMSAFTNKQILQQAGIAMIAQANQLPKDLLRLFQQ